MKMHDESVEKFKTLLNVLFQFDAAELDFGIYRIMNYRRKEIEGFVEKDLIQAVEKEFEIYKAQSAQELLAKIGEKKKEIEKLEKDLGETILKNGHIGDKFKYRPFAKEYLELERQLDEVEVTESAQAQVFNDLYTFFSRYYEDGDFISKRRYSSRDTRYAIPYNGEEVKLYWANFDQYYVKTGEVFKDYEFSSNGWRIIFRTTFADVESGNVKGERRYFLLAPSDSLNVDTENKACLVQFEYRQLTEEDLSKYNVTTKAGEEKKIGIQQDELNTILNGMILEKIKEAELKAILSEKQDEKTVLEKHLYKYTHKITSDFFIHKNLKGFLDREIDYFIKTDVLDINNLTPRHVTRAKVVENIGKRIIEFLSQIEDYQKLLWEKKKFVLRTDYVITTDRTPEEFHEEILGCNAQLQEWVNLGFGQISKSKDLIGKRLPVDTKYFNSGFKERLLEQLSEQGILDDLIDGILIKSENWQALNLLLGKYRGKIQCIYIDPPFNTGKDFIYKDKYRDSSWLTLMDNRLRSTKNFLHREGSLFVHLDWNANFLGRHLLKDLFPSIVEIAWNTNATKDEEAGLFSYKSFGEKYVRQHDTILQCALTPNYKFMKLWKPNRRTTGLSIGWLDLISYPQTDNPQKLEDYGFYVERWDKSGYLVLEEIEVDEKIYPIGDIWNDLYSFTQSEMRTSENVSFDTQKPENLLRRIIQSTSEQGDAIMDFFAGSGTTPAVAHKLRRKWIGVEMENCFEEFYSDRRGNRKLGLLGRLKVVLAGDREFQAVDKRRRSHLSIDINWLGGGFFKYHYLEQYEDTLHNIEFPNEGKGQLWFKLFPEEASEYVMKYMLRYETEGSLSLLNLKQFESPFEYKLRIISDVKGENIVSVDMVETFNYLLGLKVGRYKFLRENGRKYVIVLGERGNRMVAVVWRPTKDIDLEKDRKVIDKAITDFHPDEIFINGDAFVKDYKVTESEFKALMGV